MPDLRQTLLRAQLNAVRSALHNLWRNPGFAVAAISTLALAAGVNGAMFSVIHAVMLRSLPYQNASRLCVLWKTIPRKQIDRDWTSYPTFSDWKRQNHTFEDLALFIRPDGARVILNADPPEQIQAARVSLNFFDLLGVPSLLGLTFTSHDKNTGTNLAILSFGLWTRRFGADPGILGRSIESDHARFQVIAVMPADFQYPSRETQLWLPINADPRWPQFQVVRLADAFAAVGRLKPEVSVEQAQAGMDVIAARLARQYPATDAGLGIRVVPLRVDLAGTHLLRQLQLLLGAVGLVLLIACTNVASLFLTRGFAQRREFAIRVALGAGRSHILRHCLTEILLLGSAAGTLALAIAALGVRAMVSLAPPGLWSLNQVRLNPAVLAFTLGVALLAALLSGLGPAWKFSSSQPQQALGNRSASGSRPGSRVRGLLVFSEFALAIVLLTGTGLLLRSFARLQETDLGFPPDRLLTLHLELPEDRYSDPARTRAFVFQTLTQINALPGVSSAAVGNVFFSHLPNTTLVVEGRPARSSSLDSEPSTWSSISPGFFETMRVPLLQGRFFSAHDTSDSPRVTIVNQSLANRVWPGENPLGKRFDYGVPGERIGLLTVVGVTRDIVQDGPGTRPISTFYLPFEQRTWPVLDLVVRTASDSSQTAEAIRRQIRRIDPSIPRFEMTTVPDYLWRLEAPQRFQIELLSTFSLLAIGLAAIGIYGVMAYAVGRRTQEIAIRMALGAQSGDVLLLILFEGLVPALAGLAVGLLARPSACACSRLRSTESRPPIPSPTPRFAPSWPASPG